MRDTTRLLNNKDNNNKNQQSLGQASSNVVDDDETSTQLSSALSIDSKDISNWPNRKKIEQMKKERCKTNLCHFCWLFLGLILLIGGIQIIWAPTMLENIVRDGITEAFIYTEPRPNDENYQKWVSNDQGADSIPIKVYLQFFNVTNPEDMTNGELNETERMPIFNLTPPIVYTQYYYRENISFSEDKTMARSYFKTKFFHDPELSEIEEDDVFTVLAPLVSGGLQWMNKDIDILSDQPAIVKNFVLDFMFEGFFDWLDSDVNNLFSVDTARNLIFDILDFKWPQEQFVCCDFLPPWLGPNIDVNISEGEVIDFQYGMLKNGSGSWYISHTGYGDETRMGEVLKWSDQPQNFNETGNETETLIDFDGLEHSYIDCWYPGLPYSPSHFIYQGVWNVMENPETSLPPFFVSTLKKALLFDYDKPIKYKDIPAEQYNVSTGRQFLNASLYPPNAQFYQFGTSGVFNMTHCFNDLPLFFSLPSFYGAPDFQVNNSMLNIPEPEDTLETNGFLQVEPMTGAILNANVALQGNVPIEPIPPYFNVSLSELNQSLRYLPSGIMAPTYLLRYEAHLPDAGAEDLAAQINLANNLDRSFYIVGYICIGLGILWWSFSMYWMGKNGWRKLFPGLCCNSSLKSQVRDSVF